MVERWWNGAALVALALAVTACGGGDPEPGERPGSGAVADDTRPVVGEPAPGEASAGGDSIAEPGRLPLAGPETAPESGPRAGDGAPPRGEPTEPQPEAEAILRRAERAYAGIRTLQADFVQQVTVPLLNQTQNSRGRIYHQRPDRFLMDFSDPEGDVVVADGRYLWMYYPSTDPRQVMRTPVGEGGQSVDLQEEFLSDATERFSATLVGRESVGGRPADVLFLTPRTASPYRNVKVWVDREDALVRRFEIVEENETLRRLELRNLRPNLALSGDLFRFTPPPGAQIFEP